MTSPVTIAASAEGEEDSEFTAMYDNEGDTSMVSEATNADLPADEEKQGAPKPITVRSRSSNKNKVRRA